MGRWAVLANSPYFPSHVIVFSAQSFTMRSLCYYCVLGGIVLLGAVGGHNISKRSPQYSIETKVFVDSHAINSWKAKVSSSVVTEAQQDVQTRSALTNYIRSAFNDLNTIFAGLSKSGINMDARIESIEFVTENISSGIAGSAESPKVLEDFREWLSTKTYPVVDHTMLITGLDLMVQGDKSKQGRAYLNNMCSATHSLLVVEALGSVSMTTMMAHELAHNLGANHDGENNACVTDRYIMRANVNLQTATSDRYLFSTCSVDYIKAYLASGKAVCLTQTTVQKLTAQPLGQLYTPDQMCQLMEGQQSHVCRVLQGKSQPPYSSLCLFLWCDRPSENNKCYRLASADGFVCGKGKRCSLGQCVNDTRLSTGTATDECPLGDSPAPLSYLDNQQCSQAIANFSGHCYDNITSQRCCKSCESVKTDQNDCVYGDRSKWCIGRNAYDCYTNSELCCGTCKTFETGTQDCMYGDRSPWCIGKEARYCYYGDNANLCCGTCQKYENSASDCMYGDRSTWCIGKEARYCYYGDNANLCCGTCQKYENSASADCKYGDKQAWCADMDMSKCPYNQAQCCAKCL
ncbi:A disintegrin and metalloproteinase with thrombospondin motifs 19-like isoform X2 [Littorina saxatilis]|uniref:A disintegrin and metalloproteinase with thrombospondin motifs 19-like isoform X2 n=1 Tax=Littorina saxatilis TaxID=31220 RepID=UPI0038B6167E